MDEFTTELLKSGVGTEIFKIARALAVEGYDKLEAKIANACHKYDKEYRDRHGEIKAYCTGMRQPIPLDDVYVGVQFLGKHAESRYRSPEEVEQAFRQRRRRYFASTSDKRQDGIQVANDEQYLMLLGGPGVGKSTFLRKVGLEVLNGKRGNFEHKCIPVFLELKRFREDQINIEALIAREFEICGFPHPEQMANAALKSGKLLILFDGLDEVPSPNVDNVIDKIGDFVDQYSQNRFIASCRIAAYSGGFRRFTEVEMADFDDTQIEEYIKKWFDSTPDQYRHQLDEEMETAEQCWETLNASGHSATKELVRNPLLLTLLCMVYDNSQNFSRNRANLYADALNIFLKEWAAEKRVNRGASITQYLDIADEKRMLSEIAAKNFDENRFFFSKDELITQIREFGAGNANTPEMFNAPEILETILVDQGLFVEQVSGSYSFSHLTFQEYLTANYIVGDPRSIQGLVNQHLYDPQWREIFLLTAGLMREADDLLLAMEAEAVEDIDAPELGRLLRWVEKITDCSDDQYNRIVKKLFAIRQFFSLWMLNKIYEEVDYTFWDDPYYDDADYDTSELDQSSDQDFEFYLLLDPGQDLYQGLEQHLYQGLDLNFLSTQNYRGLNRDRDLYLDLCWKSEIARDPCTNLYQDIYRYMNSNSYPLRFFKFGDQFSKELDNRIAVVERMEQMKIFNGVDLQRMVQRFKAQREFIKPADEGESGQRPTESIHGTWLSVLGITHDMFKIPREALEAYVMYVEAVELIVACKEAAGRVSPEVWQQIEDRF